VASQYNLKIEEGISYGIDATYNQIMQSGWSREGHPADYTSLANV